MSSATSIGAPSVVIAILTYRRPETLPPALLRLQDQLDSVPNARVVVVDNDVEPTALPVVGDLKARDPRFHYVHEPEPGIAAARNRALEVARHDDLVIFIDDDEEPGPDWLSHLVGTWATSGRPAAVVGPVISVFESRPETWIEAGGFFQRLRHTSGAELSTAASNNLLLDLAVVAELGLRFDPAFGLSGGSDTVFTRALSSNGYRIVWCDEAVVYDQVPDERNNRRWVCSRAKRLGNSDTRANVHLAEPGLPRLGARLRGTVRGALRVAVGGLRAAYGRLSGSAQHHARGTRMALRGAGMLSGSWGSVVTEYGRS